MAYAVGGISGGHFNPAVTLGLAAAGRFNDPKEIVSYIVAQVLGGILAAFFLCGTAALCPGRKHSAAGRAEGPYDYGHGESEHPDGKRHRCTAIRCEYAGHRR